MAFPFRRHPQARAVPVHVAALGHRNIPVPVNRRRPQLEYTDGEQHLKDHDYIHRPIPASCYFRDIVIPNHPVAGTTYLSVANQVVRYTHEVLYTVIPERIMNDQIVGRGLRSCQMSVHRQCIALAIHGFCLGWNRGIGTANATLDSYISAVDNDANVPRPTAAALQQKEHVDWFVLPLVAFLVKEIVPQTIHCCGIEAIVSCNIENARTQQTRRTGRCMSPMWTEEFALGVDVNGGDRAMCKGHYYPFACLLDRVMVNFFSSCYNTNYFMVHGTDANGNPLDIDPATDIPTRNRERFYSRRV